MEVASEIEACIDAASLWEDRSVTLLHPARKGLSAFAVLKDLMSVLSDFSQMIPFIRARQWIGLSAIRAFYKNTLHCAVEY